MNLLPHIFRKDVRHFWPEILLNLALLIAFAHPLPQSREQSYTFAASILPILLRFLIPVGWLVMISRLLHDEALVGDRQFWITRPYTWTTLLLEKALFLIAFLHLPLLLMQIFLLHRAGFPIAPSFAHLLAYQLWVGACFDLPFAAIGVLTPTLTTHVLGVLGAILYLIAVVALGGHFLGNHMAPPSLDWITVTLAVLSLLGVILLMYARRPTAALRWFLIGVPPALVLLWLCAPAAWMIHHAYAATPAEDQLTFVLDQKEQQLAGGTPMVVDNKDVIVEVPIQFQAARSGQLALVQGAQITLRSADGYRWTSGFQSALNWSRSGETSRIGLRLPLSVYGRLRNQSVNIDLQVVSQTFITGPAQTVVVPASRSFPVPFAGLCNVNRMRDVLQCKSALWEPSAADTTFEVQDNVCGAPNANSLQIRPFLGGTGGLHVDFDPVYTRDIPMWRSNQAPDPERPRDNYLCPGARIRIAPVQPLRREELTLSQPNVTLSLYVITYNPTRHYRD